jgi:hypothetical protein
MKLFLFSLWKTRSQDTQHSGIQYNDTRDTHKKLTLPNARMLNALMLSVFILNAFKNVIIVIVVLLNVPLLNVPLLNVLMISVFIPNAFRQNGNIVIIVLLNVVAPMKVSLISDWEDNVNGMTGVYRLLQVSISLNFFVFVTDAFRK